MRVLAYVVSKKSTTGCFSALVSFPIMSTNIVTVHVNKALKVVISIDKSLQFHWNNLGSL